MNNRLRLTYVAALDIADQADLNTQKAAFRAGFAQLFMDMNDLFVASTAIIMDVWYLPNSTTNMDALTFGANVAIRNDVKRYVKPQLSKPTVNQGLVIISATDAYENYYTSSIVCTLGTGLFVRVGLSNFTQTEDNNPFTDADMIAQDYITAYFPIVK